MPITIVPEDGTGRADANAPCPVATVTAYWTARGGNAAWTGAGEGDGQAAALVLATDYLLNQRRYRWRGAKATATQRLPWPRTGATEQDGPTIPATVVPPRFVEAACRLAALAATALAAGTTLEPALDRGGKLASVNLGGISLQYAPDAPPETVYPDIDGLLAPLLRGATDPLRPVLAQPAPPRAYTTGAFDNPRSGTAGGDPWG